MTAKARITAMVEANPEIGTSDSSYVSELVDRAMNVAVAYCNLSEFPGKDEASATNASMESATAMLVEAMYAKAGLEGIEAGSIPLGASFSGKDMGDNVRSILNKNRQLWPSSS